MVEQVFEKRSKTKGTTAEQSYLITKRRKHTCTKESFKVLAAKTIHKTLSTQSTTPELETTWLESKRINRTVTPTITPVF